MKCYPYRIQSTITWPIVAAFLSFVYQCKARTMFFPNMPTKAHTKFPTYCPFGVDGSHIYFLILDIVLVDINECSSSPCMNGATCTDAVNSYTCACVAGYTGTHCETGESLG